MLSNNNNNISPNSNPCLENPESANSMKSTNPQLKESADPDWNKISITKSLSAQEKLSKISADLQQLWHDVNNKKSFQRTNNIVKDRLFNIASEANQLLIEIKSPPKEQDVKILMSNALELALIPMLQKIDILKDMIENQQKNGDGNQKKNPPLQATKNTNPAHLYPEALIPSTSKYPSNFRPIPIPSFPHPPAQINSLPRYDSISVTGWDVTHNTRLSLSETEREIRHILNNLPVKPAIRKDRNNIKIIYNQNIIQTNQLTELIKSSRVLKISNNKPCPMVDLTDPIAGRDFNQLVADLEQEHSFLKPCFIKKHFTNMNNNTTTHRCSISPHLYQKLLDLKSKDLYLQTSFNRIPWRPASTIKQCTICWSWTHGTRTHNPSATAICKRCGLNKHLGTCSIEPRCANCLMSDHNPTNPICPRAVELKEEALKMYNVNSHDIVLLRPELAPKSSQTQNSQSNPNQASKSSQPKSQHLFIVNQLNSPAITTENEQNTSPMNSTSEGQELHLSPIVSSANTGTSRDTPNLESNTQVNQTIIQTRSASNQAPDSPSQAPSNKKRRI